MTPDARIRLAKWYGEVHGYKGKKGGWIYEGLRPRPICQGWLCFYFMMRSRIWAAFYR